MIVTESIENYLETILELSKLLPSVRSIDIANKLNFKKPSISIAMKNLSSNGYIDIDSRGFITLTEDGKEIAEKIYERHLVLSTFLMKLGVDKKTAVHDACRIEHDLSDESFAALKNFISDHSEDLK